MSDKIKFAIDKNFDFAIDDPVWKKFFLKFNITPVFYTDMKVLTEDMKKNTILISYLPTANFFYFKSDTFYVPIANALFASNKTSKISSLLIVAKDSPIESLPQLQNKALGYIHPFCTSSYFAPALLLCRHHFSIHHFFASLNEVGPWQLQVDAVISGKVDATMVQEDVWLRLPDNTKKTRVIAREDNLPSPLILTASHIDATLLKELKEILFTYKPKAPLNALFNEFIPFQKEQVENFFAVSTQAFAENSN